MVLAALMLMVTVHAQWEVKHYADEFGDPDPAAGSYLVAASTGTFSNSATTNSELVTVILLQNYKGKVVSSIKLLEYGSSVVKAYTPTKYIIKIKDDNAKVHIFNLYMADDSDSIYDFSGDITELIKANSKLKIRIDENGSGYNSSYSFVLNCIGATTATNKIK